MNTRSLSSLYQSLVASRPAVVVDADTLAASVEGEPLDADRQSTVAGVLAASPAHARLARLLQALRPDSETLAADVAAARAARTPHPVHARGMRIGAAAPRRARPALRWAGALAAGVALAFGIGAWQHQQHGVATVAQVAPRPARPDRIFVSNDRIFASTEAPARRVPARDELFRSNFSRATRS